MCKKARIIPFPFDELSSRRPFTFLLRPRPSSSCAKNVRHAGTSTPTRAGYCTPPLRTVPLQAMISIRTEPKRLSKTPPPTTLVSRQIKRPTDSYVHLYPAFGSPSSYQRRSAPRRPLGSCPAPPRSRIRSPCSIRPAAFEGLSVFGRSQARLVVPNQE